MCSAKNRTTEYPTESDVSIKQNMERGYRVFAYKTSKEIPLPKIRRLLMNLADRVEALRVSLEGRAIPERIRWVMDFDKDIREFVRMETPRLPGGEERIRVLFARVLYRVCREGRVGSVSSEAHRAIVRQFTEWAGEMCPKKDPGAASGTRDDVAADQIDKAMIDSRPKRPKAVSQINIEVDDYDVLVCEEEGFNETKSVVSLLLRTYANKLRGGSAVLDFMEKGGLREVLTRVLCRFFRQAKVDRTIRASMASVAGESVLSSAVTHLVHHRLLTGDEASKFFHPLWNTFDTFPAWSFVGFLRYFASVTTSFRTGHLRRWRCFWPISAPWLFPRAWRNFGGQTPSPPPSSVRSKTTSGPWSTATATLPVYEPYSMCLRSAPLIRRKNSSTRGYCSKH